ncbi:cystathionine gamma-synthase family protein [Xylophilus rhododendri]|uniref:Cystathionine gamma-synthase family protein n=1 Tax=Xylophilus rhododendri TaxID=2697032 RepID=A0A857JA12_9BURK|nr:cystathionine gamma-synthase family protein [Xylophilus rhododendri]QHJ00851.1 cystathionine gamma-synthase family protein [Xylophilus rhododendri]
MTSHRGFTTDVVHSDKAFGSEDGSVHKAIHTSTQYGFDKVEDLIGVFQGTKKGAYVYSRQGTPTTAALEAKLTQMEAGVGTVSFASGMAAICGVFLTLLRAGDHLVASRAVFGNTNSIFGTLGDLGIGVSRVDASEVEHVAAAITPATRMVFVETLSNPGTQIADLEGIGRLCRERGLLFVVDNTILSPYLFRPGSTGAGLVVHSLTKSICGHGNALGGAVVDTGLFDWSAYPNISEVYRKGDTRQWGLTQIRKKGLRDMGGTLSAQHAHAISVGAETLALRMRQTSAATLEIARYLEAHPAIAKVYYPGLSSHPQHERAQKHFLAAGWLLSFELKNADACLAFIDRLQLAVKATGLGDTRTLVIPVAHTIFWEAGAAVRAQMGISDGMVRLSVGLEETADLIADLRQALERA